MINWQSWICVFSISLFCLNGGDKMIYVKQEFKSGEKLYASQLNSMDEQIFLNTEKLNEIPSKSELVTYVLNALPTWQGGAY